MRWLLALVGAAALVAGSWAAVRMTRRPELRVALNLRPTIADDEGLAAGVDLALDDRDHRAGRWRLKTAHQVYQPDGTLQIPEPCAHTMLYGLGHVPLVRTSEGHALRLPAGVEAAAVLARFRAQNLQRLVLHGLYPSIRGKPAPPGLAIYRLAAAKDVEPTPLGPSGDTLEERAAPILQARPDLLYMDLTHVGTPPPLIPYLRKAGYAGPIFLAGWSFTERTLEQRELDGCRVILGPLPPPPADFLRRFREPPSPFVYAGFRGARRYLDALDARPAADPLALARERGTSIYEELRGEPRVYRLVDGRLSPE